MRLLIDATLYTFLMQFFFKGGLPPEGRFNPPIASMAVCEVYKLNIRKNTPFVVT